MPAGTPIFPKPLRREIIVLICVKVAALFLIYQLFFADREVPPLNHDAVSRHLTSPAS